MKPMNCLMYGSNPNRYEPRAPWLSSSNTFQMSVNSSLSVFAEAAVNGARYPLRLVFTSACKSVNVSETPDAPCQCHFDVVLCFHLQVPVVDEGARVRRCRRQT